LISSPEVDYLCEAHNGLNAPIVEEAGPRQVSQRDGRRLPPLEQHSRILTAALEPRHPNYFFKAMHDHLSARGLTIHPGKIPGLDTIRLANLRTIDRMDIEAILEVLRTYLDHSGIL
jgi:hypothetical protein